MAGDQVCEICGTPNAPFGYGPPTHRKPFGAAASIGWKAPCRARSPIPFRQ